MTVLPCLPPLLGFREEYPGGGIYRHQFEQWTGNVVMNIVFRYLDSFLVELLLVVTLLKYFQLFGQRQQWLSRL